MSCRAAGITVLLVTGDHEATALSVARKVRLTDGLGEQSALKVWPNSLVLLCRMYPNSSASRSQYVQTDVGC